MKVRGMVKFDGKPLPKGSVGFYDPATHASGLAAIDPQGNYTVALLPGELPSHGSGRGNRRNHG